MSELKPCPFCDSTDITMRCSDFDARDYRRTCLSCGARGPKVTDNWNDRPDWDGYQAKREIADLRTKLDAAETANKLAQKCVDELLPFRDQASRFKGMLASAERDRDQWKDDAHRQCERADAAEKELATAWARAGLHLTMISNLQAGLKAAHAELEQVKTQGAAILDGKDAG